MNLSEIDMQDAAAMLAQAFDDSPLFRFAFPKAAKRDRLLRALFVTILRDALDFGRVEVARNGRIVGMFIWYPPGAYPMTAARILRLLPKFLGIVAASPIGVLKLQRAQARLNRMRPSEPHCHGCFLAALPGDRAGAILSKILLDEADAHGWPIYLETQERRSVDYYWRLGFKILGQAVEVFPGSPPTWTMWREPRVARVRGQMPKHEPEPVAEKSSAA